MDACELYIECHCQDARISFKMTKFIRNIAPIQRLFCKRTLKKFQIIIEI